MAVSYTKKIKNEMEGLELSSDKFIPYDKYYIIRIKIPSLDFNNTKTIGKICLTRTVLNMPLVTYVYHNEIFLIFSCVEEDRAHYLSGSHQRIISEYVSFISVETECSEVSVSITEFESKTQIITYLTWKVYSNSQICASILSNHEITIEDATSSTQTELIEKLEKVGVRWNDLSNEVKYGIFLKLKKEKNTYVVSTLSEYLDARNSQKYINYIFGEL